MGPPISPPFSYRLRGTARWGFGIQTMWIVLGNTFVGTLLAWLVLADAPVT